MLAGTFGVGKSKNVKLKFEHDIAPGSYNLIARVDPSSRAAENERLERSGATAINITLAAGGGTIGPALTFGYLAGEAASREAVRSA